MARSPVEGSPPTGDDACDPLSDKLRSTIAAVAGRIAARGGMSPSDKPDVEQSLTMAVLSARRIFDPGRGSWEALARMTVQSCSKNLLRDWFAQKRKPHGVVSLQITVKLGDDEGVAELSQLITRQDAERRLGTRTADDQLAGERAIDVDEFVAKLPHELRELARALERKSVSELSRHTGVPRGTIYERVARLKRAAEDAGLGKYFE